MAHYLIIPVQAQFLAMRGMAKITNVVATVRERLNPALEIGGIVITQFDRRKTLNKSVAELVKDAFCDKVFRTVIRDNVSLAEAPIKGKNIFEYNRNSNGAKDRRGRQRPPRKRSLRCIAISSSTGASIPA